MSNDVVYLLITPNDSSRDPTVYYSEAAAILEAAEIAGKVIAGRSDWRAVEHLTEEGYVLQIERQVAQGWAFSGCVTVMKRTVIGSAVDRLAELAP